MTSLKMSRTQYIVTSEHIYCQLSMCALDYFVMARIQYSSIKTDGKY